jgi:hypothetical protein
VANPTLNDIAGDVLLRLGDTAEDIWSSGEIRGYVKDGYRRIALTTKCFWDSVYLEDQPYTGSYTKDDEIALLGAGATYFNKFTYTKQADAEYAPTGTVHLGPANHTKRVEYDNDYVASPFFLAVHELPEDALEIERATWNQIRLAPLRSIELEREDQQFQTQAGEVQGYVLEKDGVNSFRKWRIPSAPADVYTVTGSWGCIRDCGDISEETVHGSWGLPRRVPGLHPMDGDGVWGCMRRVFKSAHNTKIEYSRHGLSMLDETDECELPPRYAKYLRHYAQYKALERNGDGQDTKLAGWWKSLYEAGVARMIKRKSSILSRKVTTLGGEQGHLTRPPTARLPWQYGYPVR